MKARLCPSSAKITPFELMKTIFKHSKALSAVAALALCAFLLAQGDKPTTRAAVPNDPNIGEINLTTRIGSFKLLDGIGRVEVSFTGTILVSQLKGTVTTSGNLRKEYTSKTKEAWHGTGKIVIDGEFRAVQWFGTNLSGKWRGRGTARIYGEFDTNLETGYYWYSNDPSRKIPWSMYGMTIYLPEMQTGGSGQPVERKPSGKPGGG